MDLLLLIGIATALLVVLISLYFFQKSSSKKDEKQPAARGVPVRAQEGIPRRAQIARNQRNRVRAAPVAAAGQQNNEDADDDSEDNAIPSAERPIDEKMGAKKRAKLEAKAEKKAHREAELLLREEKKKKDAEIEEERKKVEEKAEEEERKKEEAERLAREERERKEHEEYLKLKAAFSIEEEGFEEGDEDEKENLLQEFVQHIKDNKVVVLEDLANHFKLKTQQAIDRISELQKNGTLTGVIDDRGKFIYISSEELQSVAKFIRQRGRVSITELAECSNKLINLSPIGA